ncbi:MAG: hypothetical protein HOC27_08200 [Phycisphaerae bacterium]|nr:hypothetical protein [Phycisphaerae bacterium]
MFQRLTTILLLSAITIQAVFGGLQDTVSICLGGGHEHEVAEVVEHCEMECSHHNDWVTPITKGEDIDNCKCTDLELTLIMLISVPRDKDEAPPASLKLEFLTIPSLIVTLQPTLTAWVAAPDYPPILRQQLAVVRITRLLV